MPSIELVKRCLGDGIISAAGARAHEICEIRLRVNRPARMRLLDGSDIEGTLISQERLSAIVSALNLGSYYAVEDQLREGYFTMQGGIRVGVCGKMNRDAEGRHTLSAIGSVCIRIPREVKGCALPLWERAGFANLLILSKPGMGKTTLLRDYLRIASDAGYNIAIADERREIAACMHGIPQMDVGRCTDVMDGCAKEYAMGILLRSCAPDMIAVDEISFESEGQVLREASKCGVKIAATAHASSMDEALSRKTIGSLIRDGIFSAVTVLGSRPGKIEDISILKRG